MRRSRASLVLFFGTFATLLLAVGFADGGHQSPGRPADLYRLDVDDAFDGWSQYCGPGFERDFCPMPSVAEKSTGYVGLPGSEGWILVPMWGSPIGAALYVAEDAACLLAYVGEGNGLPATATGFGACTDNTVVGRPIAGPVPASRDCSAAASSTIEFGCDGFFCPGAPIDVANEAQPEGVDSDLAVDDRIVFDVAAVYAGLPTDVLWQNAIDHATRCEFAWDGCNGFPDASLAGWLDDHHRAMLQTAEVWRSVGQVARRMVDQIVDGRDRLIAATSQQILGWLSWPAAAEGQASRGPTGEPQPTWPRTGRSTGLLLSL